MRKLAWLHATPEGSKKSRMTTFREADAEHISLTLPDIQGAEYIVGMLQEAGLMSTSGMGPVPLSWQEIEAWIRCAEVEPELWERLMVKELSEVYVGELNQASGKDRPSPYTPTQEKVDREAVVQKFMAFTKAFKKRRNAATEEIVEE